ncbi:MAG TPA: helix-turn-helix transcriptional regulator [Roseiflexaceae bacterium]|nr:helix-turn-helix transcriptional regulator [Roseiflexaceae bacterium]
MSLAYWRVREIAEPKGWNAHSLAIEAKLSYNTIYPIWAGTAQRVDLKTIEKLAVVLQVMPGELFGIGEPPESIDSEVEGSNPPTL